MGIMIESIWLFSLAVLIIAVGLLVYYFKKRIAEVENKSSKSLEIVHDLYMQQMKMKSDFNAIIKSLQEDDEEEAPDNNIQFTLLTHELKHTGGYEEAEEVQEQQEEVEPLDIKTVNVDMSLPDEEMIEITNDDEPLDESDDDDEPEQPELMEDDRVVVDKIGSDQSQRHTVSKEDLKKMTPSTLKSLIISKGVSADAVHKMKKNELIDVLLKL